MMGNHRFLSISLKKWSYFGGPHTNIEYIFNEICMIIGFCMIYISQNIQNISPMNICIRHTSVIKKVFFGGSKGNLANSHGFLTYLIDFQWLNSSEQVVLFMFLQIQYPNLSVLTKNIQFRRRKCTQILTQKLINVGKSQISEQNLKKMVRFRRPTDKC